MRRGGRAAGAAGAAGAIAAFVVGVVALGPAPGASAQAGESIEAYDVDVTIQPDATLAVAEHIRYDFGATEHHGIYRDIPVRFDYDSRYERLTTIDQVHVTATGASSKVKVEAMGRQKRIRIGDPKRTITGVHDYTLTYRVRGAMNAFSEHDELAWNAVGTGWAVPIHDVSVTVSAPGAVGQVACFAGPQGSQLACSAASSDGGPEARFAENLLYPYGGLTAVVSLPKGEVTVPPPILDERWAFDRAFSLTPGTVGATGALSVVVLGLLLWAFRVGRDRRYRGSPVDAAFGNVSGEEERVPLLGREHDPVEFEPPDGIRPGQVGTLIDESADPLDVSATIVDLAVRGYLRIEEVPGHGWRHKADWTFTKLKDAGGLLPYEERLLNGLFKSGDEVKLSSLKLHFAKRLQQVQEALYQDVVRSGWFRTRPDQTRIKWTLLAVLFLVLASAVAVILTAATHAALVGVPLVVGALAMLIFAHYAPRRTAKGYAVYRRVNGFRQFIEQSEKERARFAERANIFSEYLPYAVVFGVTEKWAKAFAGLEDEVAASTGTWYVSPNPFVLASFADSLDGFAVTTSGTIVASASSSSSGGGGFSGGGFGGGGGGSW